MIEEWWGRTFEGRGSVHADHMSDVSVETIRKLSTFHLLQLLASEGDRSTRGLMCAMEKRRREEWTARFASVVSVLALVVSVVALFAKA